MKTHYFSCAETAKLVRAALKREFPAVKFSVRSSVYSGGASIRVGWSDGPTVEMVNAVAKSYSGADFDGMIDMKVYASHWLMPDGSVSIASCPGTEGSKGSIPAIREWMPHPDAKLAHFGADYIFTDRRHSERFVKRLCAKLVRDGYPQFNGVAIRPASQWSGASIDGRLPYDLERTFYDHASRFIAA